MKPLTAKQRTQILGWAMGTLKKEGKQPTEDTLLNILRYAREKQRWDLNDAKTVELLREVLDTPTLSAPERLLPPQQHISPSAPQMTQVGMSKATRQRLREIGMKGQTYDQIIRQLIQARLGNLSDGRSAAKNQICIPQPKHL